MKYTIFSSLVLCLSAVWAGETHRIGFGSCHSIRRIQNGVSSDIWNKIAARNPGAWVWGGDNIYADFEPATPENLELVYNAMRDLPDYKRFVQLVGQKNIAGTWDDHDYGLNNAGLEYVDKLGSQQKFLDYFNVPLNDSRRTQEGVFNSQYFFDGKVKVVLLDNRYFRDSYKDREGDFLGEAQWSWLEKELNENLNFSVKATIIVSGLQMISDEWSKNLLVESYAKFGESRQRLLDTITASAAPNVILVSGDVHYSEMSAVKCTSSGPGVKRFVIPELTTSGMTHALGEYDFPIPLGLKYWYKIIKFEYQYEEKYTFERNFGEIDFYFADDDLDSTITVRSLNSEGEINFESIFPFSTLQSGDAVTPAKCVLYTHVNRIEKKIRYIIAFAIPLIIILASLAVVLKILTVLAKISMHACLAIKKSGMYSRNDLTKRQDTVSDKNSVVSV